MTHGPGEGDGDRIKQLQGEIGQLRSLGLHTSRPPHTPALRHVLGIPERLSDSEALLVIRHHLVRASQSLPPKLRQVFLIAAGATSEAPSSSEERKALAASQANVHSRTVLRHCKDKAIPRIVDILLYSQAVGSSTSPFEVIRLHVRLDLKEPEPRLVLTRRIRLLTKVLDSFQDETYLPGLNGRPFHWRELDGCTVDEVRHQGIDSWAARVSFPRRLQMGETHSFSTTVQLPSHDAIHPELGFHPHSLLQNIELDLEFGERLPSRIEVFETTALHGVPPSHIKQVVIPTTSRWRHRFREFRIGFASGVRWFFDEPTAL